MKANWQSKCNKLLITGLPNSKKNKKWDLMKLLILFLAAPVNILFFNFF